MYSEKATKFCEISTLLLSYLVPVKSKVEISQNFVAFSEHMNFKRFNYRLYLMKASLQFVPGHIFTAQLLLTKR